MFFEIDISNYHEIFLGIFENLLGRILKTFKKKKNSKIKKFQTFETSKNNYFTKIYLLWFLRQITQTFVKYFLEY